MQTPPMGQLDPLPHAGTPQWSAWLSARAALPPEATPEQIQAVHAAAFVGWNQDLGPPPVWIPAPEDQASCAAGELCQTLGLRSFAALHAWSVANPAAFWKRMASELRIVFDPAPHGPGHAGCLNGTSPVWYPGARLNIAASCFLAPSESTAIRYGRMDGTCQDWSVAELQAFAMKTAGAIRVMGIPPGAAVGFCLPMTPEAVGLYLGAVWAGVQVASVAESFSVQEMTVRFRMARVQCVFTQERIARSGGKTLPLSSRVAEATAVPLVIVGADAQTVLRPGDLALDQFLAQASCAGIPAVRLDPESALHILFSSGTTGEPKAIPWTQTTPIKGAVDARLHLDVRAGDVVAWPTSLGWMMGPWLVFASLLNQATLALYEGPPGEAGFGRFVAKAGVTLLGTVPSLVRAWRVTDALRGIAWPAIRAFATTGECSAQAESLWLSSRANWRPVIEYCGGTEIGGGYITGSMLQPQAPSAFSTPAVGQNILLLDEAGHVSAEGEVFLRTPSVGLSTRLIGRDHAEAYFKDCPKGPAGETLRRHGDRLRALGGGYFRAEGRADDAMNLGGIKVGCLEIERVAARVPGVREVAAIAVPPAGGGPDELALVIVPGPDVVPEAEMLKVVRERVKRDLNPLFTVFNVVYADALPRTATGKVMRRVLRDRFR